MGIMLASFLGGAAKQATEDIEEEEKRAAVTANQQAKAMFDNYNTVKQQNEEISGKLKSGIDYLKANGIKGSEEEYLKAAKNPLILALIGEKVKNGGFDPNKVVLKDIVGDVAPLDGKTAKQAIDSSYDLSQQVYKAPEKPNQPAGFIASFGNKAAEDQFNRAASVMGVSPDILRATQQYKRPDLNIDNTYNLSSLYTNKTAAQMEDEAKANFIKAQKSGDPAAIANAAADAKVVSDASSLFSEPQRQFMNKIAGWKDKQLTGTDAEKKDATANLNNFYRQEREEAIAKHIRGEGSDKIPALGALNSFTASAVNRALIAEWGPKLKEELAAERVDNGDGTYSTRLRYTGTEDAIRAKIQMTEAKAAREALSIWTDPQGRPLTRDVLAVAKSYPMPDESRLKPTAEPSATSKLPPPAAAATPSSNPVPLPVTADGRGIDKTKLIAGQKYSGAEGVKTWDGTQFK
jgi:cell fate (sporulation/competence/biofilm development) regulator YlbF (YheA/YmcA/DUF963 family)